MKKMLIIPAVIGLLAVPSLALAHIGNEHGATPAVPATPATSHQRGGSDDRAVPATPAVPSSNSMIDDHGNGQVGDNDTDHMGAPAGAMDNDSDDQTAPVGTVDNESDDQAAPVGSVDNTQVNPEDSAHHMTVPVTATISDDSSQHATVAGQDNSGRGNQHGDN